MDIISHIRAFNRDYTARLGLMDRSYLGSGLTLTQVRVLQEIGFSSATGGGTARAIATLIGADEGYLSRILADFVARGRVRRDPDPEDARRNLLFLTDAGQAAFAPLEAASRNLVSEMIAHLPGPAQGRLDAALREVSQLLSGEPTLDPASHIRLRDLENGDLGWVTEAHGRLYGRDEGYDLRFEALVARILADYVDHPHPNNRAFIAVTAAGHRLGSSFVVHEDDTAMRLRLVLLEPEARGLGLGKRMLDAALDHARTMGYRKMVLWTHESHRAACALYAGAGFSMCSSEPGQSFGVDVVDQVWEKIL